MILRHNQPGTLEPYSLIVIEKDLNLLEILKSQFIQGTKKHIAQFAGRKESSATFFTPRAFLASREFYPFFARLCDLGTLRTSRI